MGGELRADAGSVGGGWRGAVRTAPEPKSVSGPSGAPVGLRRAAGGGVYAPRAALSPHLPSQPSWLPI